MLKKKYMLSLLLLNSAIDFYFTWHFYFPPLKELIELDSNEK